MSMRARSSRRLAAVTAAAVTAGLLTVPGSAVAEGCLSPSGDGLGATDRKNIMALDGTVVRLCAGVFYVNNTVDITKSGTKLIGAGLDKTVIRATLLADPLGRQCGASSGRPLLEVNARPQGPTSCAIGPASGVEVADLTLDGAGTSWAQSGLKSWDNGWTSATCTPKAVPTLRVRGSAVRNFAPQWSSGIYLGNVCDVVLDGNTISNIDAGGEGIGIALTTIHDGVGQDRTEHVRVLGNTLDAPGARGITCGSTPDPGSGSGSTAATIAQVDSVVDEARHVTVAGNTISNVKDSNSFAIEFYDECDDSVIERNRVDQGISVVRSSRVAVRANNIVDLRVTGRGLMGLEIGDAQDVVAADNVIDSGVDIGLFVGAGHRMRTDHIGLLRNDVRNAWDFGGWLTGDLYEGVQSVTRGVYLDGACGSSKCGFRNTIGFSRPGLHFRGRVTDVTATDLAITGNTGYGVSEEGGKLDRFSLANSTVANNVLGVTSWTRESGPTHLRWEGNTCGVPCPTLTQGSWATSGWNPPSASLAMPTSAAVGEAVSFRSTSTDADGIARELWDLGTGGARTAGGTVVYDRAGTYVVTLIVWDGAGQASAVKHTITVGTQGQRAKLLR